MHLARRLALSVAGVNLAVALPAAACSPAPGYRAPTNLGLVQESATIVLARVVGGTAASASEPEDGTIVLRPLETIKGEMLSGDLELSGMSLPVPDSGAVRGFALSNPFEFERAHEEAYNGACIRRTFPLGTTALFFLERGENGWRPAGGPFTRWAEDVPKADAPWVQLVRLYTIAAGLPEEDRRPFLEDEREALMARTGEPLAQLMAEDIGRQLENVPEMEARTFEDAFRNPSEDSAVEASLRAMREGAAEAGN